MLLFEQYCPDDATRESYELSEDQIKNIIQEQFLIEMKNRYP